MMVQSDQGKSPLLVRWFVDYNPFYVLSAMCMLFGVFAINNSLNWSPIPLKNLLTMIVTLNVYEAALIGLAMLLLGVNIRRDALLLMLIEAFFLVDVGFLNMEVFTVNFTVGLIVNGLLMLAAVVKLALLFRMAGLPLVDGKFGFVVLALAVLYAIPGIFAMVSQPNDVLSPMWVFLAWWLAGFLPVAFVMLAGSFEIFAHPSTGVAGADRIIGRTLILLPLLSLVAHLCLENWVYKVTFEPSNIAPLLLGMAVAIGRLDRHVSSLAWRMRLALVVPIVAIGLAAIRSPKALTIDLGPVAVSPLRLVLIASAIVYIDGLLLFRTVHFAVAALFCLASAGMGHNVQTINHHSLAASRWWWHGVKDLVPQTTRQWGIASVAASFVLLLSGAVLSMLRREAPVPRESGTQ